MNRCGSIALVVAAIQACSGATTAEQVDMGIGSAGAGAATGAAASNAAGGGSRAGAGASGANGSQGGAGARAGAAGAGGSSGRGSAGAPAGTSGSGAAGGDAGVAGTAGAAGTPADGDFVEDSGAACSIAMPAAYSALAANDKLPDPFERMDGTRIGRKDEWSCRRAEVSAQAQQYELGAKPPKSGTVTGSMNGNTITVDVTDGGTSISFAASVDLPSGGTAPYPAMIGIGGISLDAQAISRLGVATITFNNSEIAAQTNASSRGMGKFYTLHGADHSAGAMIAWAWAVSRLIDVLETLPSSPIDARRLGVTGCSRNGKGALIAGAFDERIALTIPQESGSGGSASWRVSDAQRAAGQNVQTLAQITGENVWFTQSFSQFNDAATRLPFDHHQILGLVAPRGLLVIENTSMEWLGNLSCYTSAAVSHEIWEALGVPDNMGVSQVGGHDHCRLPASQQPEVTAFIQKFLLDDAAANTAILKTDGDFAVDASAWVDWTTPALQ